MTPTVQALVSRPCRSCDGTEFSYVPKLNFSNAAGGSSYGFTVVACRQCQLTDLFADIADLEAHRNHAVVRAPVAPFR